MDLDSEYCSRCEHKLNWAQNMRHFSGQGVRNLSSCLAETKRSTTIMATLPFHELEEIVSQIFSYHLFDTLHFTLAGVCRLWRAIVLNQNFWKQYYENYRGIRPLKTRLFSAALDWVYLLPDRSPDTVLLQEVIVPRLQITILSEEEARRNLPLNPDIKPQVVRINLPRLDRGDGYVTMYAVFEHPHCMLGYIRDKDGNAVAESTDDTEFLFSIITSFEQGVCRHLLSKIGYFSISDEIITIVRLIMTSIFVQPPEEFSSLNYSASERLKYLTDNTLLVRRAIKDGKMELAQRLVDFGAILNKNNVSDSISSTFEEDTVRIICSYAIRNGWKWSDISSEFMYTVLPIMLTHFSLDTVKLLLDIDLPVPKDTGLYLSTKDNNPNYELIDLIKKEHDIPMPLDLRIPIDKPFKISPAEISVMFLYEDIFFERIVQMFERESQTKPRVIYSDDPHYINEYSTVDLVILCIKSTSIVNALHVDYVIELYKWVTEVWKKKCYLGVNTRPDRNFTPLLAKLSDLVDPEVKIIFLKSDEASMRRLDELVTVAAYL